MSAAVPLRFAEHLVSEVLRRRWRCELREFDYGDLCSGVAAGVRWEDGFADAVCEEHAERVERDGGLVVRPRRHDGTDDTAEVTR